MSLIAIERMKCVELTHTRLLVSNYKECYEFYSSVLQFPCTWGDESSNYAQFTVGTTQLAIFEKQQMLEDIGESFPSLEENMFQSMLIFRVANVDRKYEDLKSKVHFINEPHDRKDWGIRVAHFKDPEGNVIEINHSI
jgi:lactoylglutathione lyase